MEDHDLEMCDIEVEDVHCYYANGVLTHNCGQEIAIPTLWTKDPGWLDPYKKGEDQHRAMAAKIETARMGRVVLPKEVSKVQRGHAKAGNFGFLYGQTGYSFARNFNLPTEVGEEYEDLFWKAIPVVTAWKKNREAFALANGYTETYFKRRRPLNRWLNPSDPTMDAKTRKKTIAYGLRSVISHSVQGSGGDIMRIALNRLYRKIRERELWDRMVPVSTIHDEINCLIRADFLIEGLSEMTDAMVFPVPGWPGLLKVGYEIGYRWGSCVKMKFNPETKELSFDGNSKTCTVEKESDVEVEVRHRIKNLYLIQSEAFLVRMKEKSEGLSLQVTKNKDGLFLEIKGLESKYTQFYHFINEEGLS